MSNYLKESMELQDAVRFLAIELPVTKNQLKRAYHRRSLEEHPDHSKHPQAEERFNNLTKAYEFISTFSDSILKTDTVEGIEAKCEDGTLLSKLGKGLGPTTNGVECGECRGRGFGKHDIGGQHPCFDCGGYLAFSRLPCLKCNRSGVYKVNGVARGKCFACNGTGMLNVKCKTCHGTRWVKEESKIVYNLCLKCKGCGELPMWNPVLPRGLLL